MTRSCRRLLADPRALRRAVTGGACTRWFKGSPDLIAQRADGSVDRVRPRRRGRCRGAHQRGPQPRQARPPRRSISCTVSPLPGQGPVGWSRKNRSEVSSSGVAAKRSSPSRGSAIQDHESFGDAGAHHLRAGIYEEEPVAHRPALLRVLRRQGCRRSAAPSASRRARAHRGCGSHPPPIRTARTNALVSHW